MKLENAKQHCFRRLVEMGSHTPYTTLFGSAFLILEFVQKCHKGVPCFPMKLHTWKVTSSTFKSTLVRCSPALAATGIPSKLGVYILKCDLSEVGIRLFEVE